MPGTTLISPKVPMGTLVRSEKPSANRLVELASAILRDAIALEIHLKSKGLPEPSFDIDAPSRLPIEQPDAVSAYEGLLASTRELHHLALGPLGSLTDIVSFEDPLALSVISRFKVAQHVPINGQASFDDLARKTGIPVTDLKPLLRMAMTSWVFTEPTPGMVAHTAASRHLSEDPLAQSLTAIRCEEHFAGSARAADALAKYSGSEEPHMSPWGIANNAQLPLFDELAARHPERAANFFKGMTAVGSRVRADSVLKGFDWATLGKAQVVDVGGAKGPVSIALARAFSNLSFVVQDFEEEIVQGQKDVPSDVKDRVSFMAYDMFTPQPVKDADVYFFRAIFHNWPDKYCIRILQNLVPVLKKGAKVFIHDPMMLEKGKLDPWKERQKIGNDIRMFTLFNSHDREADHWKDIFAKVDSRFRIVSMNPSDYTSRAMLNIEVVWDA